ncbi:helix-turn-helix transcriptional regulator [Agromyces sp. H3Y2-19a]|uniref:PadR family transcriptional regulator n=1 Tax=Agromyces TaxID=33877 RepID=UPI001E42E87F|nr:MULTISPECIES: helix-turn-helix transcriptional regulator [Agromyces]MCD5345656.1 PadR family transcriptional regulator [Agromyces sp. S2-1-8]MDF0512023.1 helix-turn-helix transcriptional regulator [Agromyces chromiiresistens]
MARRREGRLFDLEVDILAAGIDLQHDDGDFYGFALAKRIAERNEAAALTAHGTLYKALARMTEAGLLESTWEEAVLAEAEGRPRRRLYRVTGAGELAHRAELAAREPAPAARPKAAFA